MSISIASLADACLHTLAYRGPGNNWNLLVNIINGFSGIDGVELAVIILDQSKVFLTKVSAADA
jgi:hypothetical protein